MNEFGLPGGAEWLIILGIVGMTWGVVYPLWRICTRLGYPGYLALLYFVPLGFIILLWVLAFGRGPVAAATQADPAVVSSSLNCTTERASALVYPAAA